MKLVKMSLAAAVAVAGLSTASFAEIKITGNTDFRWKSWSQGDTSGNKLDRSRVNFDIKAASKDGKGNVHVRLRTSGSEIKVNKAYAKYKLGMVTLGLGPKMGFPGNFSDSTISGIKLATKVAGFSVAAAFSDQPTGEEAKEKAIITAKGKVSIATLRFDYKLGDDKKSYLALDTKVKVGPATITAGYAAGQGDNNKDVSIMGTDVAVGLGNLTVYGAFSMSGKEGGKVTENAGYDGNAIGGITDSMDKGEVTAMAFGVKTKVAGIAVQGYYSMATPDGGDTSNRIYVDGKKNLNTQSSINVRYYIDDSGVSGADSENTIEVRLASKF
jgi:hypothetical protein